MVGGRAGLSTAPRSGGCGQSADRVEIGWTRNRPSAGGGRSRPVNAYEAIRSEVVAALEREPVDPDGDPAGIRDLVDGVVRRYQRRAHLGEHRALVDPVGMAERIVTSVTRFGPLSDLLARTDVEEVFIEGDRVTFLDADGRLQGLAAPTTESENRQLVDRLLAATRRRLDGSSPLVQARVLEGTARLTAAQPPVSDRLSATIRRHRTTRETLRSLVERGSLSVEAAGFLWACRQTTTSTVISGPPGSGKTTLLAATIAAAPSTHCIRCCEEIRELDVPLTHGACYEARPPALDGSGEVTLRQLVKFVLAMRPDLIVVGEVRGAEAFELTRAVNAGCGFACTVHANSARDALSALVNAATMAGENVREDVVRRVFAGALDVVAHLEAETVDHPDSATRREVTEIVGLVPALTDGFSTEPLFVREAPGRPLEWTGALPVDAERIERCLPGGMRLREVLEGSVSPL